jgi:LytS/YehU family sensor histidine kinase
MGSERGSFSSLWTVVANPLGYWFVSLVIHDAQVRSEVELNREATSKAQSAASDAQLVALRARVHPHFLFNALNAIAALCQLDPKRAVTATTTLGELMRRSFETDFAKGHSLESEIELVKKYVYIEKERFGSKLDVSYDTDQLANLNVPEFGVQILVENAILHGVRPKLGPGVVFVVARNYVKASCVAVADNGVGFSSERMRHKAEFGAKSQPFAVHGLDVLERQIVAHHSAGARLRVVKRPTGGSLAVIRLPHRSESAGGSNE